MHRASTRPSSVWPPPRWSSTPPPSCRPRPSPGSTATMSSRAGAPRPAAAAGCRVLHSWELRESPPPSTHTPPCWITRVLDCLQLRRAGGHLGRRRHRVLQHPRRPPPHHILVQPARSACAALRRCRRLMLTMSSTFSAVVPFGCTPRPLPASCTLSASNSALLAFRCKRSY